MSATTIRGSSPAQQIYSGNYPLAQRGVLTGFPYQGAGHQLGYWQSDNAVAIAAPVGTDVVAVTSGIVRARGPWGVPFNLGSSSSGWEMLLLGDSVPNVMPVGINGGEGWGAASAATVRAATIGWDRTEIGPGNVPLLAAYGFRILAVIANSADGTLITTLSNATQAALAVTQLQANPQVEIAEFMNEPWLKGGQAHAVKYARMYMAALTAIRAAGITTPLPYASTGSWQCQATTQSCTLTNGSPIVSMASTDEIIQDQSISGTNVPAGSWVGSLDPDGVHFTIGNNGSPNALGSGASNVTFATRFSNPDDPSGNHGWIYRPAITVSGLKGAILANGISLHPYGMPTEDSNGHAGGIAIVGWHKGNLASRWGTAPPIYVTEFGYSIDGVTSGATTGVNVYDQTEQATRTGQALDAMVAQNIAGIFQYDMQGDGFGLLNVDGTPRSSLAVLGKYTQAPGNYFYNRLSQRLVTDGQHVVKGQVIGKSGGANGVPHLHIAAQPPLNPQVLWG